MNRKIRRRLRKDKDLVCLRRKCCKIENEGFYT